MLPKLPAVSNMLKPKLAPTKPIPTPRVSTNPMEISPTPSLKERSEALSVSPGTALCDQKRKAVLEQLLESPQTQAKQVDKKQRDSEIKPRNNATQHSPAAAGDDDEGGIEGFDLHEGVGPTYDDIARNGGVDHSMGEEGSKDLFGVGTNIMDERCSFFGGGDDYEGAKNARDESFAFSFGADDGKEGFGKATEESFTFSFGDGVGVREEGSGKDDTCDFEFSFGGGFEESKGSDGFSLF